MKKQILYFLLLAWAISLSAQNADWIQQSPPATTESLFDLEIVIPGTIVAVGDNGTIIKSTDGGINWRKKNSYTSGKLYDVEFISPTTGFVVGASGIIRKTIDGGETWTNQNSGINNTLYCVKFINPQTGWACGTNHIIKKTTDGGETWVTQYNTESFSYIEGFHAFDANKLIATGWGSGTKAELYTSQDGGTNWTGLDLGNVWMKRLRFLNTMKGWIAGVTYFKSTITTDEWGSSSVNIEGEKAAMWKTEDGGETWTTYTFNESKWLYDVGSIDQEKTVAVGENGLILYTSNNGTNWSNVSLPLLSSTSLRSVQFESTLTGYIAGDNGTILKTSDGGLTWSQIGHGGTTNTLESICFVNDSTGWSTGSNGTIINTTNGGNFWKVQKSKTTNSFQDIQFIDSNRGWCVGYYGTILNSTDSGTTWTQQTSGTTKSLYSIHFISSTTGWAVGESGTILHTSNGGTTWNSQTSGITNRLESLFFLDELNGWAGCWDKIIHTTDGGNTWNTIDIGNTDGCNDLYFTNQNTGWFVGGAIYKTTDGGLTWSKQFDMDYYDYGYLFKIHFLDNQVGYISAGNGKILITNDGGNSWGIVKTDYQNEFKDVCFANSTTGWVIGYNGLILKTTNGGGNVMPMVNLPETNLIYPENYTSHVNLNPVLKWQSTDKDLHYQLNVLKDNDTIVFEEVAADSVTLQNLEANSWYNWSVRTINNEGITGNWASSFTFITCSPPSAESIYLNWPYKFTPLSNAIQTTLEWSKRWDAANYRIQVSKDSIFNQIVIDTTVTSESIETLLEYSTAYYWHVTPFNSCGSGGWSETGNFFTQSKPYINISTPSSWSSYFPGDKISIFWIDNIDNNLLVLLYKGATVLDTIGFTIDEYQNNLEWTITDPTLLGNDFLIVVKDTLSDITGKSGKFSIMRPNISAVRPEAGTKIYRGSTNNLISWSDNLAKNLVVLLYKNEVFIDTIFKTSDTFQFSFLWDVNPDLIPGNDYYIVVKDPVSGISGNSPYFSIENPTIIVSAPTIDTKWEIGSENNQVSWYYKIYNTLLLLLYKGNILTDTLGYTTDAYVTAFSWNIPLDQPVGSDYQIGFRDTLLDLIFFTQNFTIYSSTGFENFSEAVDVNIYPNPGKNLISVEFNHLPTGLTELELYSIDGRMVIKKKLLRLKNDIDVFQLQRGIYIAEIKNGNLKFYKKLIKN